MSTMKLTFKEYMSKAKYENKLMTMVEEISGLDPTKLVYKAKHKEHDGTVVWLYYWTTRTEEKPFDTHIGSWCKGQGWAYDFDANGHVAEYMEAA